MSNTSLLRKDQLESSLHKEKKLIEDGKLKEDSPLDMSDSFHKLCMACRKGDLKLCQEMIMEGANINARDPFDYTPLILASLCGHYEVVQLLLEAGALCERDTFQGERCLYNALNNRIRNLLLSYDYSKSSDPLQPLASHLASLLHAEQVRTTDIAVIASGESFRLHKLILSARSPYFSKKLDAAPETATWKLPPTIPPQAFGIAVKYLYLGELPRDLGGGPGTGFTDSEILAGTDKISKHFEIQSLSEMILDGGDRRLARQRRTEEMEKGRDQLESWFKKNVLQNTLDMDVEQAEKVKWDRDNSIFADVLLRADMDDSEYIPTTSNTQTLSIGEATLLHTNVLGIPMDSQVPRQTLVNASTSLKPVRCRLFPCHRAMLIRSEFFLTMFSSSFREAQNTPHLQIIPISCSPPVLEVVLTFLYTERVDFPLSLAVDILFAADQLFLDKLKMRAAVVISTLGNGSNGSSTTKAEDKQRNRSNEGEGGKEEEDEEEDYSIDIYEILHAAWLTHVQRLEEFAARYIAYRLERYIDEPEFADILRESAARISARQETDSIELLDDIRWYLSERFRLRFEDVGLEEMMDEEGQMGNDHEGADGVRQEEKHTTETSTQFNINQTPHPTRQEQHNVEIENPTNTFETREAGARIAKASSTTQSSSPIVNLQPNPTSSQVDDNLHLATVTAAAASGTAVAAADKEGEEEEQEQEGQEDDEFANNAIQYRHLLSKIDLLLESLDLDA